MSFLTDTQKERGGGMPYFPRMIITKNKIKYKNSTKQGKEAALRACSFVLDFQVID